MNAINHGLQLDLAMNEVIWNGMGHHPKLHQLLRDVQEVHLFTFFGGGKTNVLISDRCLQLFRLFQLNILFPG